MPAAPAACSEPHATDPARHSGGPALLSGEGRLLQSDIAFETRQRALAGGSDRASANSPFGCVRSHFSCGAEQ